MYGKIKQMYYVVGYCAQKNIYQFIISDELRDCHLLFYKNVLK